MCWLSGVYAVVLVVEDNTDSVVCLTVHVLVVRCVCCGFGGGRQHIQCSVFDCTCVGCQVCMLWCWWYKTTQTVWCV